jgi:hypothetical protein
MKIRVRYACEGRDRDYVVSPIGGGMYNTLEEYQSEMLRWFPNAIVEAIDEDPDPKSEIIEFEL